MSSLYVECIKLLLLSNHSCLRLLQNSLPWSTHNLFGLRLDSFTIYIKAFRTVLPFLSFNPIQDGHFGGCSRMGGQKGSPLPKVCHTYPTMMKIGTVIPYVKKIQKIYESRDTPPTSTDISNYSPKISKFCYMKKYRSRLHFST